MAEMTCKLRVVFTNRKCVSALRQSVEILEDMAESYPWDDGIKKLRKRLRYIYRHITLESGGCAKELDE